MDPDKCLLDILELLDGCSGLDKEAMERNREEAISRIRDLTEWLRKGGFPPNIKNVLERL
jgi:hypothetical protein